jgi:hypothetical protein
VRLGIRGSPSFLTRFLASAITPIVRHDHAANPAMLLALVRHLNQVAANLPNLDCGSLDRDAQTWNRPLPQCFRAVGRADGLLAPTPALREAVRPGTARADISCHRERDNFEGPLQLESLSRSDV